MPQRPFGLLFGYMLALFGGVILSFDILTFRFAEAGLVGLLVLRSGLEIVAALIGWMIWRIVAGSAPPLVPGRHGLLSCLFYGVGTILFVFGVVESAEQEATGAFLFLVATAPLISALFALIFLGERPGVPTWIALVVVMIGVIVIGGDPLAGGVLVKLYGVGIAISIAAALTVSRASGRDMGFTALIASAIPVAFGLTLLVLRGDPIHVGSPFWLCFNGLLVIPVAFFCLAQAPKFIPAPQVALFYLLETTLAPVWLWLALGETVAASTLIGGALVVGAVFFDTLMQLRRSRWRRPA